LPIAEPLLPFVPCYATPNDSRFQNVSVAGMPLNVSLKATLDATVSDWNNPLNNTLQAILLGLYSQTDPAYIDQFTCSLDNFIEKNESTNAWGNLDITQSALLLNIFVQGLAGLKIYGGVAETRFYYEEFRTAALTGANMPSTWKAVKVGTHCVQNTMYYAS